MKLCVPLFVVALFCVAAVNCEDQHEKLLRKVFASYLDMLKEKRGDDTVVGAADEALQVDTHNPPEAHNPEEPELPGRVMASLNMRVQHDPHLEAKDLKEERRDMASNGDCYFNDPPTMCSWSQDTTNDDRDWWFSSSKTPSSLTGPDEDHTPGHGGKYAYLETSSVAQGAVARMISPTFPGVVGNRCMRFFYHMYGSTMGSLRVKTVENGETKLVFIRETDQGEGWHEARIDLTPSGDHQIYIEAVRGNGWRSDIAIDDITFVEEPCYPNVEVSACEHDEDNYAKREAKRIMFGNAASPAEYPWQVYMKTYIPGTSNFMTCGGTLVDRNWVLTAAHCMEYNGAPIDDVAQIRLHFGELSIAESEDGFEESQFILRPEAIFIHPDRTSTGVAPADVALLKLPYELTLNDYVNTACLPDASHSFPEGTSCRATGWGIIDISGARSEDLLEVEQRLVTYDECRSYYGAQVNDDVVCANQDPELGSVCQGDSGGPLMCEEAGNQFVKGVVSWVYTCGKSSRPIPGVFADTQYYYDWITQTMEDN